MHLATPMSRQAGYSGANCLDRNSQTKETMKNFKKAFAPAERQARVFAIARGVRDIMAGKGFDFQTRYAACCLPLWLQETSFQQLFFEGSGDIDIRFTDQGKSHRTHIQVKDHEVSPCELKSVVDQFNRLDWTCRACIVTLRWHVRRCPQQFDQLNQVLLVTKGCEALLR